MATITTAEANEIEQAIAADQSYVSTAPSYLADIEAQRDAAQRRANALTAFMAEAVISDGPQE